MRDEHDGGVERCELPLEPLEVLDVEMVRRLVEEQQVGVAGERARERCARQLAARERVERPVEVGVAETEPAEDGGGPIAPRPPAGVLESRLRLAVAAKRGGVVDASGHRALEPPELLFDRDEIARAGKRVLAEAQPLPTGWALVVERHPGVLGEGELASLQ